MKKKKLKTDDGHEFDPEVLKSYMTGATTPSLSQRMEKSDDLIDLHLEKHEVGKSKIPPQDALFLQLEKFEYALDNAIAAGKLEMRVIHGLGKGKLKEEIYKLLEKHPHLRSYSN